MKKRHFVVLLAAIAVLFLVVRVRSHAGDDRPLPDAKLLRDAAFIAEGESYSIVAGEGYRFDRGSAKWVHMATLYDPKFFEKNYVINDGVTFRKADDGRLFKVLKTFESGFEEARSLRDLIGEKYCWTACTLQSPSTPTVADYVALRNRILRENAGFIDNSTEPSQERAHSGSQALKCYSVASGRGMQCAKASIETELLHFANGDDFWYSGWYYIQEGQPLTLIDLESTWIEQAPGLRLMFEADKYLMVELKWAHKPTYRQPVTARVAFPHNQWVHIVAHFKLSEKQDGVVQVWQDSKQLIDTTGQTLPIREAIYNSLEIGISATQQTATLFVDDIKASAQPLQP